MTVLRERHGQALIRYDDQESGGKKHDMRFEWWFNTQKMKEGVKLEEENGKTRIYCYEFKGSYREHWLMEEFDRRVPRHMVG
ncbi:MAG: hypothetical protein APF77_00005 [Clostridia bacterium BRH_c25]|nr:MAG: hypothetical protein APF77_00005 [Clostridia bacterium BRH_c25]